MSSNADRDARGDGTTPPASADEAGSEAGAVTDPAERARAAERAREAGDGDRTDRAPGEPATADTGASEVAGGTVAGAAAGAVVGAAIAGPAGTIIGGAIGAVGGGAAGKAVHEDQEADETRADEGSPGGAPRGDAGADTETPDERKPPETSAQP